MRLSRVRSCVRILRTNCFFYFPTPKYFTTLLKFIDLHFIVKMNFFISYLEFVVINLHFFRRILCNWFDRRKIYCHRYKHVWNQLSLKDLDNEKAYLSFTAQEWPARSHGNIIPVSFMPQSVTSSKVLISLKCIIDS